MSRFLIIGASGLVGSHLFTEAKARGHEVYGTFRTPIKGITDGLGFLNLEEQGHFPGPKPDVMIHAAGFTNVDGCEADPDRAMGENYEDAINLAWQCNEWGIRFCYISSIYAQWPKLNVYARSKAATEQYLLAHHPTALIPRLISVWGTDAKAKCFPYAVMRAVKAGETMRLPKDQITQPTWAGDAARWILDALQAKVIGIVPMASTFSMSRVEWARKVCPEVKAVGVLTATLNQAARRPLDCTVEPYDDVRVPRYPSAFQSIVHAAR